jgi:hypothetical protein
MQKLTKWWPIPVKEGDLRDSARWNDAVDGVAWESIRIQENNTKLYEWLSIY